MLLSGQSRGVGNERGVDGVANGANWLLTIYSADEKLYDVPTDGKIGWQIDHMVHALESILFQHLRFIEEDG